MANMSGAEMAERVRKRWRLSTAAASGDRNLALVAHYSNIGASMETHVVIGGDGPNPIASSSPPKTFRTPALLSKKLLGCVAIAVIC